jgi:anti-anti-sigma factor
MKGPGTVSDAQVVWHVEPSHGVVVVHVAGEIDLATEDDFAEALAQGLDTDAALIVIDLTEVSFLGSSALRVLLEANMGAEAKQRQLRIALGSSFARRVISVAGLDQILDVYETVAQAIGSRRVAEPTHGSDDLGVRDAL